MQEFNEVVRIVALAGLVLIFLYVSARTIAWAYFKAKLKHFRQVLKEMKEGD